MANEEKGNQKGEKKSPFNLKAKEAGSGVVVGAIITNAFVWPKIRAHLQEYWKNCEQYHFNEGLSKAFEAKYYHSVAPDALMESIAHQNKELHITAVHYAREKLEALNKGTLSPSHCAMIAGSVVAIAALTIGIMRCFEHQNQEHTSPSARIDVDGTQHELLALPPAMRASAKG